MASKYVVEQNTADEGVAANAMGHTVNFTDEEENVLKEMVIIFDESRDCKLQENELYIMLQLLGAEPSSKEVQRIMKDIDVDGNNCVDFVEFKNWLSNDATKRKLLLQKFEVMKKVDVKLAGIMKLNKSDQEVVESMEKQKKYIRDIEMPSTDNSKESPDKKEHKKSNILEFFILSVVVFTLFFPDAWEYSNLPEKQDIIRNIVVLFCIVIFIYEVVVKFAEDVRYRFSLFMWMDVIGVLVLFTDLTWILEHLHGVGNSAAVLRATRATKLGLRSKELLKVLTVALHLIHRFLIHKGTKVHAVNSNADKNSKVDIGNDEQSEVCSNKKESNNSFIAFAKQKTISVYDKFAVGGQVEPPSLVSLPKRSKFTSVVVKDVSITIAVATRVAMTVMVLVIIVPFLVFVEPDTGGDAWLDASIILAQSESTNEEAVLKFTHGVENFFKNKDSKLHLLKIDSPYLSNAFKKEYHTRSVLRHENVLELSAGFSMLNSDLVKHRLNRTAVHCMSCSTHFESVMEVDLTHEVQMHALYSMMISLLVLLVLVGSTFIFVHLIHSLPMEELVDFCRSLALQLDAKVPVKL